MFSSILRKVFGSRNDRLLKKLRKNVDAINALEAEFEKLSDEALKAKTDEFKTRSEKAETLDDIIVEDFATVRDASKGVYTRRHCTD